MSNTESSLSEQQEIRLEKLQSLRELGVDPYPFKYDVTHHSKDILDNESEFISDDGEKKNATRVSVAGRVMTQRIMGKASFFTIQDSQFLFRYRLLQTVQQVPLWNDASWQADSSR